MKEFRSGKVTLDMSLQGNVSNNDGNNNGNDIGNDNGNDIKITVVNDENEAKSNNEEIDDNGIMKSVEVILENGGANNI